MGATTFSLYQPVLQDNNVTPSFFMACVKYSTERSNYGQPHAFGKIKSLVRSHFKLIKPHVELMSCFEVQFYTNFFKAKLNSCHPTQVAISELLQKRDERFELQRSSSLALISIRFVFQTGGRKSSKYSQTYKSKQ